MFFGLRLKIRNPWRVAVPKQAHLYAETGLSAKTCSENRDTIMRPGVERSGRGAASRSWC